jgi:peptidoglycan/LPS O-acetylase OafA/YrhL
MSPKPNLDLLRAIAVVLVLVDHVMLAIGASLPWGWQASNIGLFGVYLFFVHTSLVLMWSLERRPNVPDFYIRRVFRIYPLAIVMILLAVVTRAPVGGDPHTYFHAAVVSPRSILFNCLLVFDIVKASPIIYSVTWSLPPEIYMYVLLPALFFYARTIRMIWPLVLLWALAGLIAHHLIPSALGNNILVVSPDFICGVIAYVGFMRRRENLPSWVLVPLLALLFCLYMSFQNIRMDYFCCLALSLILPRIRQFQAKTPEKISHTVATYSYGIYLTHPFCIVLGLYVLAGKPFPLQLGVIVLSLAAASFAAYHLIERPMIGLGARVAARLAHERGLPSEKSLDTLEPAP